MKSAIDALYAVMYGVGVVIIAAAAAIGMIGVVLAMPRTAPERKRKRAVRLHKNYADNMMDTSANRAKQN